MQSISLLTVCIGQTLKKDLDFCFFNLKNVVKSAGRSHNFRTKTIHSFYKPAASLLGVTRGPKANLSYCRVKVWYNLGR